MFTYGYWLSRLRGYPGPLHAVVRVAIAGLGLEDKVVYINTRDSMEICAVKNQDNFPFVFICPIVPLTFPREVQFSVGSPPNQLYGVYGRTYSLS